MVFAGTVIGNLEAGHRARPRARVRACFAVWWLAVLLPLASGFWMPLACADIVAPGPGVKPRQDVQEGLIPPPVAQPVDVSVVRGKVVEIPLAAATSSLQRVEFVVRSQPSHGTLGPVLPDRRFSDRAKVLYHCQAAKGTAVDEFRFAARVPGAKMSAPVEVVIRIEEPYPALESIPALGFAGIRVGEVGEAMIEVTNTGTGPFDGPVSVPAPWRGPPRLMIDEDESVKVLLFFEPAEARTYRGQLVFQADSLKGVVQLSGDGLRPFLVRPSSLEMTWNGEEQQREAALEIENMRDSEHFIGIRTDDRLQLNETITIPPGETARILLKLPLPDVASYQGKLVLSNGVFEQMVEVAAAPAPARIRHSHDGEFHFGFVPVNVERRHVFTFENTGGEAASLQFRISGEAFAIEEGERTVAVAPGETAAATVIMNTGEQGVVSGALTVTFSGDEIEVPLRGTVLLPAGQESGPRSMAGRAFLTSDGAGVSSETGAENGKESNRKFWSSFVAQSLEPKNYDRAVPWVKEFTIAKAGKREAEVAWKPAGTGYRYELEMYAMGVNEEKDGIISLWLPYKEVTFQASNGNVVARLRGLKPGSRHVFRVLTVNPLGEYSLPSYPATVQTRPPLRISLRQAVLWGLVALLIVLVAFRWRNRVGTLFARKTRPYRSREAGEVASTLLR